MRAREIRIHQRGSPEVFSLESAELTPPSDGEVLLRHTAIGLNFIDTYHRSGLYPVELPAVLGVEAAGVVEALGPGVEELEVGQRVAYAARPPGAYCSHRVMPAKDLVPLPDDIDDETAAAALLKGMTVEYLVRRTYPVQAGDTVLLHAAAGGVGLIACQWLAHLGATVIGTVGSDEKAALAKAHGCAHTIVYTREDFVEGVRELTNGRGVPVVYDSVGRATMAGSLDCLQPRGLLVMFGNASGAPEPLDLGLLARKGSLFVTRPTLFSYTATRDELLACADAVFALLRGGTLEVPIGQRWPLVEVAEAHRALEARRTRGASILTL